MKKVLVTGGTGVVGKTLVKQLIKKGYQVRILSRNGFCGGSFDDSDSFDGLSRHGLSSVEILQGDIRDIDVLTSAVKDISIVFHLAAMLDIHPSPLNNCTGNGRTLFDLYRDINVKGTEMLIKAACRAKVDRVVFFSSISVYGRKRKVVFADENTSLCPDSFYSVSKVEAEKFVLAGLNHKKEPIGVVLRPASVYGPKEKKNYTKLIKMMQYGVFITVGKGWTKRTIVHDHDLARAAILAAEHPKANGNVYNVTDGSVHSINDIRDAIASALKKKYFNIFLPEKLVHWMISLLEKFVIFGPLVSGLNNFVTDTAVCGDKIKVELGFQPEMQLYDGWKDAVKRALPHGI